MVQQGYGAALLDFIRLFAVPLHRREDDLMDSCGLPFGTASGRQQAYPTMRLEDIKALPVSDLAAGDCVLFLWATFPMLKEAPSPIRVTMRSWTSSGFLLCRSTGERMT